MLMKASAATGLVIAALGGALLMSSPAMALSGGGCGHSKCCDGGGGGDVNTNTNNIENSNTSTNENTNTNTAAVTDGALLGL